MSLIFLSHFSKVFCWQPLIPYNRIIGKILFLGKGIGMMLRTFGTNLFVVLCFSGSLFSMDPHYGFSMLVNADIRCGDPEQAMVKDGQLACMKQLIERPIVPGYPVDGIFFIGGPGALEHLDNNTSYKIAQETFFQNKPIGAICIATRILAKAGVLHDKYATGWNEDGELDQIFAENNVIYVPEEKVVVVDNVITATDPSVAKDFGKHIVEMLQNQQRWG